MRPSRVATGAVLGLCGLVGCQEGSSLFDWHTRRQSPSANQPAQIAATPAPGTDDASASQPTENGSADPNVQKVLDFVDRLKGAEPATTDPPGEAAPGRQAASGTATSADDSPATAVARPRETPSSPAKTVSPNQPLAVTAQGEPGNADATQSDVAPSRPPVVTALYVRPDDTPRRGGSAPAAGPSQTANQPLSTDAWQEQEGLGKVTQALRERVRANPQDAEARWRLVLLSAAGGAAMEDDASSGGRLVGDWLRTAPAMRAAMERPGGEASVAALEAWEGLRETLVEQADIRIPVVALCSRVQSFGVYDVLPDTALVAHQPNRAIVYMEVDNFRSETTADGQYRTVFADELELFTETGQSLWRHEEPEIVDVSRQRRRDFFLAQIVTLPPGMPPGRYVLKATVADKLAGKSHQAIHEFEMPGAVVRR